MRQITIIACACLLLAGCAGSWSTAEVKPATQAASESPATPRAKTVAADIILTEGDITDRRYRNLGDISVTVNKTTLFNKDPTREMVDAKLREKAAEIGADAVILVRYGTVGVSFMSWGIP